MSVQSRRWYLCLLPVLAACGITDVATPPVEPWEEDGEPFIEELDLAAIESLVQAGDAEFELVLLGDGVTVSELAVRTEGDPRSEMIQSRVESFGAFDDRFVLALGGIEVAMAAQTRFWIEGEQVSREAFVGQLREDLSAGRKSPIIVERDAAVVAESSDENRFVAGDLTLGGDGTPAARLRAVRASFERVANPSADTPDAWLRFVGCRWGLRTRDGTTRAERHRHRFFRLEDFDGEVTQIDASVRTMKLSDGLDMLVARRTQIVRRSGYARSLRDAVEAMEQGHAIVARGVGVTRARTADCSPSRWR